MALSKEQLELRRSGISASEIAVIAGLSRKASPIAIYEEKLGLAPPWEGNLVTELGDLLEEPVAKLYAARTGLHLAKVRTLRHPVHALALATPDRVAFESRRSTRAYVASPAECQGAVRNVEIKTSGWRMRGEWGEPGTDHVPEWYLAQVQWQMGVSGLRSTDVAVLFDRDEFSVFSVPFNEGLWEGLLELAERWWVDHVEAQVPPLPDATERYKEYLSRAFPTSTGSVLTVEAGDARGALLQRYAAVGAISKAAEAQKKLLGNQLRACIAEHKGLAVEGLGGVNRVWNRPTVSTDWEALARAAVMPEDLNEMVPKFQRESRAGYWKLMPAFAKPVKAALEKTTAQVFEHFELNALEAGEAEGEEQSAEISAI